MSKTNSFFSFNNTVHKVSDEEVNQSSNFLEAIKAFARTTYKSIYVIDYKNKGFEYVSENPLFLCGHSAEEVKEMGYEFYFKNVPEEDVALLLKINTIGFDFYEKIPISDRKEYTISYDFRLKTAEKKSILINQKFTPLFLTEEGKIWKALCIVSLSPEQESGNIKIHKNNDTNIFEYDLEHNVWRTKEVIKLSDREKEILQYSIKGYTINEISKKIHVTSDTIKFHRKNLFDKLEVSNITEAIAYAISNKII